MGRMVMEEEEVGWTENGPYGDGERGGWMDREWAGW